MLSALSSCLGLIGFCDIGNKPIHEVEQRQGEEESNYRRDNQLNDVMNEGGKGVHIITTALTMLQKPLSMEVRIPLFRLY